MLLASYFSNKIRMLRIIGGLDPYETERKEWKDIVDLWPSVTNGFYLLATQSAEWRRLVELQELRLLQTLFTWLSEGSVSEICDR